MYYEDYYEQEPSEVDGIVEDAVEQIVQIIKDKAKEEVDSMLNRAKHYETMWNNTKIENKNLYDQLRQKNTEISKLQEDIQKKRTSLKQIPFEIGEEIYVPIIDREIRINCPECKGKGKKILEMNGEKYTCECPKCHGRSYGSNVRQYVDYYPYKVERCNIQQIKIHINKKGATYEYCIDRYSAFFKIIFKTYEEAKEYVDKKNKEVYQIALLRLEGKE